MKNLGIAVACLIVLFGGAACGSGASTKAGAPTPREVAESFDEFPILWLGESYDSDGDGVGDMPLTTARPEESPALTYGPTGEVVRPALRSFTLGYGTCTIDPGQQSCPVPVTIIFDAPDSAPTLSNSVKAGQLRLRGVDVAVESGGGLRVEAADVTFSVLVFSATPGEPLRQATRIVNQLKGANPKAINITSTSDFTPKGVVTPDAQ